MSIAIRENVRVAADHSVQVRNPLLEPGANAEVTVLVGVKPSPGRRYSAFDAMRENPIDAPENFSTTFDDEWCGA